jgi:hypothetical protein
MGISTQGIPSGMPFLLNSIYCDYPMPRGLMKKYEVQSRIYKLKTSLYSGDYKDKSGDWHDGAHDAYNKILDILNEYRE